MAVLTSVFSFRMEISGLSFYQSILLLVLVIFHFPIDCKAADRKVIPQSVNEKSMHKLLVSVHPIRNSSVGNDGGDPNG